MTPPPDAPSDPPNPPVDSAGARTGYALDRTVLANERTYAAWIRTGLTALAAGVAIERFMAGTIPAWGVRTIAVILILVSAVAFFVAAWRYKHLGVRLGAADVKRVPAVLTTAASLLLIVCALIAVVGLWLVHPAGGG
jgi:inner membrane protein YidH